MMLEWMSLSVGQEAGVKGFHENIGLQNYQPTLSGR
jgi:hypothetical protein